MRSLDSAPAVADLKNVCVTSVPNKVNFRVLGSLNTQGDTSIFIEGIIECTDTKTRVPCRMLIDTGASGLFIDRAFAKDLGTRFYKPKSTIVVINADGTENRGGPLLIYFWRLLTIGNVLSLRW